MELNVLLFDRLSVVVAVEAPRLRTLESLLIASRMPEVSWDWSFILIVICVCVYSSEIDEVVCQPAEDERYSESGIMINTQERFEEFYIARTHN